MKHHEFKLSKPKPVSLKKIPTQVADLKGLDLAALQSKLSELQDILAAQNEWSVLVVLQGMDTAGKDGLIKHVMSGVNPQGCSVSSFKRPTHLELDHDFLWRAHAVLPQRGQIGIFNRSYYEDITMPFVHPETLATSQLPHDLRKDKKLLKHRCEDIVNFEKYLSRQGVCILKFFLHISKDEQKERLLSRLENPKKNWKFEEADVVERGFWKEYQKAYEMVLSETSTEHAPWYVIPADNKETGRLMVSDILVREMKSLNLKTPKTSGARQRVLAQLEKQLRK